MKSSKNSHSPLLKSGMKWGAGRREEDLLLFDSLLIGGVKMGKRAKSRLEIIINKFLHWAGMLGLKQAGMPKS